MLFAFYLLFAQFYTHTLSPIEPGMDSACRLRLASPPCGPPQEVDLAIHRSTGDLTTLCLSGPS